jgi:hypothetical protein
MCQHTHSCIKIGSHPATLQLQPSKGIKANKDHSTHQHSCRVVRSGHWVLEGPWVCVQQMYCKQHHSISLRQLHTIAYGNTSMVAAATPIHCLVPTLALLETNAMPALTHAAPKLGCSVTAALHRCLHPRHSQTAAAFDAAAADTAGS